MIIASKGGAPAASRAGTGTCASTRRSRCRCWTSVPRRGRGRPRARSESGSGSSRPGSGPPTTTTRTKTDREIPVVVLERSYDRDTPDRGTCSAQVPVGPAADSGGDCTVLRGSLALGTDGNRSRGRDSGGGLCGSPPRSLRKGVDRPWQSSSSGSTAPARSSSASPSSPRSCAAASSTARTERSAPVRRRWAAGARVAEPTRVKRADRILTIRVPARR